MTTVLPKEKGFTLLELLIVITIMAILAAVLLPVFGRFRTSARVALAKNTMKSITIALEKYKEDFNEYPPDDSPSKNGSEVLAHHLCRRMNPMVKTADGRLVQGEQHLGPYLQVSNDYLIDSGGSGTKKLISPLGNDYSYVLIIDPDKQKRSYLVIDPGPDKLLGGDLSPDKGFVPSGADAKRLYAD
jgi:prepilin-type N-terminal cleavage/methylation domain-containing protein